MHRHEPRFRPAGAGWALVLTLVAIILSGCVTPSDQGAGNSGGSGVMEQIREVDLTPRFPERARSRNDGTGASGPRAEAYYGDGAPAIARPGQRGGDSADGPATKCAVTYVPS